MKVSAVSKSSSEISPCLLLSSEAMIGCIEVGNSFIASRNACRMMAFSVSASR